MTSQAEGLPTPTHTIAEKGKNRKDPETMPTEERTADSDIEMMEEDETPHTEKIHNTDLSSQQNFGWPNPRTKLQRPRPRSPFDPSSRYDRTRCKVGIKAQDIPGDTNTKKIIFLTRALGSPEDLLNIRSEPLNDETHITALFGNQQAAQEVITINIQLTFSKFGTINNITMRTHQMWQSTTITFQDKNDKLKVTNQGSILIKGDSIRVFDAILDMKQMKNQVSIAAKLTGLPPNTTAFDLKHICQQVDAKTCYITHHMTYTRKRYAVLSFETETKQKEALNKTFTLGETDTTIMPMDTKLCAICDQYNHLAAQCPRKEIYQQWTEYNKGQAEHFRNSQNSNHNNQADDDFGTESKSQYIENTNPNTSLLSNTTDNESITTLLTQTNSLPHQKKQLTTDHHPSSQNSRTETFDNTQTDKPFITITTLNCRGLNDEAKRNTWMEAWQQHS
ncbi:14642_t:CDS:2 [Acaulospora colombiana]|uniref:14642_t:CDS:1 n=1 Tax=Acaulospora colombiana TaxID=27376 RepID=A0ACA9LVH9_9GLOM|nr:14642_t:CDS:2 [Acaulospora colombiana]